MTEEAAMRIYESSGAESISVVRNWYVLYTPIEESTDGPEIPADLKPFRLTALEVIADRKGRFSTGRLVTGPLRHFINNNTFVTTNSTYLLVGEGCMVANQEEFSWDLMVHPE